MTEERKQTVEKIVSWALDKKAEEVKHIDVEGKTDFTDSIIICHGTAELHNQAIADHVVQMAKQAGIQVLSVEGRDNAAWILIDLGDIILHVFNEETRDFYKLEDLYKISPKQRTKE